MKGKIGGKRGLKADFRRKRQIFSQLHGKKSRTDGKNPELDGNNPRIIGKNPRLDGKNPGIVGRNPRLDGKNPGIIARNPRLAGKNPGIIGRNPRLDEKNPGIVGGNPGKFGAPPEQLVGNPGPDGNLIWQQQLNNNTNHKATHMPGTVIEMDAGWRMDENLFMDQPAPSPVPAVVPVVHHRKGKTMDYIPYKRDPRYLWYVNLSDNVVAEAVKMGVAPADATAIKAVADGIIAKYDATNDAQKAVDAARLLEAGTEAAGLAQIRAKVRNWKTLTNYPTSGSEAVLQLKGTDSPFDPVSYKPVIKVKTVPGGVQVAFVKKGVDGLAIYMRLEGATTWSKVGMDTESPFTDTTPLAVAGAPENREYMARGVLHDEELNTASDTANVTFAG